jgi:hypothetical protein
MAKKPKAPPALIRQIGRRIEATNLLPGWVPSVADQRAFGVTGIVSENSLTERKIILVFGDARAAGKTFAAMLNEGALGLDPYLPNDHTFRSAKLSGMAG